MYDRKVNNSKDLHSDEEKIKLLRSKISALHNVSIEIGNEVNSHHKYLDSMQDSLGTTQNLLKSAMNKIEELSKMKAGAFLFSFVLFVFFLFLFVHFCM